MSGPDSAGADASDARLTELLRADPSAVYAALHELRARHQPSVLAYARLCTTNDSTAGQLAAQTFALAARETARGVDPGTPWRHRLLLLTVRVAAAWSRDDRAAGLDPALLLVLNSAAPDGPAPPMLTAFQSLSSRAQGLVWYDTVEREPREVTTTLLGLTPEDIAYGTEQALQAMTRACLRFRLAASDDPRCAGFRRLIEESVRPDRPPRAGTGLDVHMARCAHCTGAHEELTALRDAPRTTLAEGLLPWAGTAYAAHPPRAEPIANTRRRQGTWPPARRRVVLASAVFGVALLPLLFLLRPSGGPSSPAAGPSVPARVTVTATVPTRPSPSPSQSHSAAPSRSPSPSPSPSVKSPSPSRSSAAPGKASHAPNGAYAQVVNLGSGRCLDIRDGDLSEGTDVVTAACGSSRTQRWRVDSGRGVVRSAADPDLCLDSRGSVDKGVGIWECASVDGDHGQNLTFTVDSDGVIRPAIAIETAVTPADGDGVALRPLNGGTAQRWAAGAS
ncbi:RICIN domain-containing protein [Streptomyces sp. NPDC005423]|uniref:RICIN domain-containing protein n=1 Tax=Streptomyces sp. NPDC005423 TaxID=3155343 RepID=UPI0033BD0E9A